MHREGLKGFNCLCRETCIHAFNRRVVQFNILRLNHTCNHARSLHAQNVSLCLRENITHALNSL